MATKPLSSINSSPRFISAIYLAIVLVVTFLAFFPSLQNKFITNDDPGHLLNNEAVRSLSLESIGRMFQQTPNQTYVPLTTLSFAVEYHFFGFNPFVYHLNNLFLHLCVVGLIFWIAVRFLKLSALAAALGALIFGIHPMHVESVAWITERKDVLYSVFYLLAVERYGAYSHNHRRRNYYLALVFALLSILSKPMALSLPLVFFILDWYTRRKFDLVLLIEKIPYVLIIAPIAWITYILNARVVGTTPLETLLTWVWSLMFYPQKFLFPDVLLAIYSLPKPVTLVNFEFLKAVVLFVAVVSLLFIYRKQRLLIFAALFYFVSIFFLLRFDDQADVNFVADRFMYLPSFGLCLALGVGCERLMSRFDRKVVGACLLIGFLFLGGKTFAQTKVWGDGVLLWSGVITRYPDCFNAYDHRGYAFAERGNFKAAIEDYNQALRLKPRYMAAYHNRALAYSQIGEDQKALADFENVFTLNPLYVNGYFNRGIYFAQRGENEKAIADYSRALELTNGQYIAALSNRGAVYFAQNKNTQAMTDFSQALLLDDRDVFSRNNRAILFASSGKYEEALEDLTKALKADPKDAETYFNRGLVYLRLQKKEEAFADFKKAVEINPHHKAALQKAMELSK
jgi:tetratricopeptide (TPR) repeat protein